jgi:nucleoside 2-deoxyribosyltransferase
MQIYLAGPLFTEAERSFLKSIKEEFEAIAAKFDPPLVTIIWPWELISSEEIDALGDRAKHEIFRRCREALDQCDIVVAWLDGPQVDDGTAWEIGYAHAKGKKVYGLRTDLRKAGECGNSVVNCMIEESCEAIAESVPGLLAAVMEGVLVGRVEGMRLYC